MNKKHYFLTEQQVRSIFGSLEEMKYLNQKIEQKTDFEFDVYIFKLCSPNGANKEKEK